MTHIIQESIPVVMVITDQDFPLAIQLTVMFLLLIVGLFTITIAHIIDNTQYLENK
jgi:hypothetical protein